MGKILQKHCFKLSNWPNAIQFATDKTSKLTTTLGFGGQMLDKRTEAVLKIVNEKAKDGYTVLKKQPLLELVPKKLKLSMKDFCSVLSFLKEQGYVDVKYQDKDTLCLSVTAKTRNHFAGLQDTKGAKLVDNQFGTLLLFVALSAFVGAFVAVLLCQLVF